MMKILAIDTSCDDTCCAVLEIRNSKLEIRSNIVSSQVKIHQKYGGVYPALAKREHQRNLLPVLIRALKQSKLLKISNSQFLISSPAKILPKAKLVAGKQIPNSKSQILKEILKREETLYNHSKEFLINYQKPKIDAIAVTTGPGLEPCLWVGVNFAKALGSFWNLKIIPVDHVKAHIFANFLPKVSSNFQIPNPKKLFPAICLVVSGGHTQLILMKAMGKYKIIGETRDDAAGECFDKTARILGLSYPGGPAIAAEATKLAEVEVRPPRARGGLTSIKLPRPMINSKDYDFSFSGLKTAVLYDFKKRPKKVRTSKEYIRKMAKEIQQAIIDVLIKKTIKAAKNYKAKTIILGGGVTANQELRKQFESKVKGQRLKVNFLVPPKNLCTDNAAMIGVTGYYHWLKGKIKNWKKIKAKANLRIN